MALKTNKTAKTPETATVGDAPTDTPKKTRTPKPPWGKDEAESGARDTALAEVLRTGVAVIQTAGSVTAALLKRAEFAGMELTPAMVQARVKAAVKGLETRNAKLEAAGKTPRPIPAWLKLDAARAASVNLSAFEDEDDQE